MKMIMMINDNNDDINEEIKWNGNNDININE